MPQRMSNNVQMYHTFCLASPPHVLSVFTFRYKPGLRLSVSVWSISFLVTPSGNFQVHLLFFLFWNNMIAILRLCSFVNLISLLPFLLEFLCYCYHCCYCCCYYCYCFYRCFCCFFIIVFVIMSCTLTVPGGGDDRPRKDGWTASYTGQFGPDYAEKRRRMGPGGRFCRSNNALQDGDSTGAAEAAHSRCHPAPNARPRHPPFLSSATQQRKQKTIQTGLLRRHPAANLASRPEILIDPKMKGEYSRTIRTLE